MFDVIQGYEQKTHSNEKTLAETQLADPSIVAQSVLSNNRLLVTSLKTLFSQDKGDYLPNVIIRLLRDRISQLNAGYDTLEQTPSPDHALQVLRQMDELYAYCLQYGLITFGFPSKEHSQIVQNLRNKVNATEAKLTTLGDQIRGALESVEKQLNQAKEDLASASTNARNQIDKNSEEFTKHAASQVAELDTKATQYANDIEQKTQASAQLLDSIATQLETAQKTSAACTDKLNEISATHKKVNQTLTEITDKATAVNEQLTHATSHTNSAATQLQNATQHAANAKAKSDAIAEQLGIVEQRREEIDAFYGEIESHKAEMLETKKEAQADLSALKTQCTQTVEEFTNQTAAIVDQNNTYQEQIKDLLHKAVSAGLFTVFKQRQQILARSRRFWMYAVGLSTAAVVVGIVAIVWLFSEKADLIFFVRLGIMIPLGFLMYFTAGQYKRERQAEEEYAFKSSISFSLEPYRDLLVKMRQDDQLEAEFVKKLMVDIFENPVKRLYRHKDDTAEVEALADALTSLAATIPVEKRKILLGALQKVLT